MQRIQSIDLMRLIAILSVIIIHTTPFDSSSHDTFYYLKIISNQLSKFAVPFFFIISGYFFHIKCLKTDLDTASVFVIKRLFILFIFWCCFYLIPWNGSDLFESLISRFQTNPYNTILEGTQIHLWFIVSLILSIAISNIFIRLNYKHSLYLLSVFSFVLFVFGVIAGSWSKTPIGIDINFNTRNGPFFSTIFFVTGFVIAKYKNQKSFFKLGGILLLIGAFLQISESYFLYKKYNVFFTSTDYVFSTYIFALGFSLLALSNSPKLSSKLSGFGVYTLGIYAVHFSLISVLSSFDTQIDHLLWEVTYPFIVLLISLIIAILFSKIKVMRRFFT